MTARLLQEPVSRQLGQPVIVENRPGGAGIVATEATARSAADGHTFGVVYSSHAANPALQARLPFDTQRDLTPVAFIWRAPTVMSANPQAGISNLADVIRLSGERQGGLNYGTPGIGSSMHLAGAMLESRAGITLTHVPYRGAGPALNDAVGGQIPLVISNVASTAPLAAEGRLRPLAVTGARRSALLPDVPTVSELGYPGFEMSEWMALVAPTAMPAAAAERMNSVVNAALTEPETAQRLAAMGLETSPMTIPAAARFVAEQIETLGALIRSAGIKPE
jgi:tripartite-type tricarboxylate transporter receptor subunit TctC